jgi:hypothetical protein
MLVRWEQGDVIVKDVHTQGQVVVVKDVIDEWWGLRTKGHGRYSEKGGAIIIFIWDCAWALTFEFVFIQLFFNWV